MIYIVQLASFWLRWWWWFLFDWEKDTEPKRPETPAQRVIRDFGRLR